MKQTTRLTALTLCLFLVTLIRAQDIIVKGKVATKTSGTPLQGVSVKLKTAKTGTVTDESGAFSIKVPSKESILVFSYVNAEPAEISALNASQSAVLLTEKTVGMDEVVVVGYGTQKKSVVTGAISSVKASDLENMPVMRIEQSLQGRASGLTIAASSGQPGADATVRVRGTTSINNSDPLYVVDNIPINGGIDYLNQSDIASIEVLKDAASAAIYGARAAAGVILVTTKKGRAGSMLVNYNGYYGTQAPAKKLKLLNAAQYATLRNEASLAGGGTVLFTDPASLGAGTDWQSTIFNNSAKIQDHELSISGGNEKSTYYASFGYLSQEGIVATSISNYERFNVRFNSNHKIKPWLNFGNTLSFTHGRSEGISTNTEFGGPLSSAINLDPITPIVITDPTVAGAAPYSNHTVMRDDNGNPYAISKYVGQEMVNPLASIKAQQGNYGWSDNITGNVFVEIEPIKGLKVRSTLGSKLAYYGSESFTPIAYFNASTSSSNTSFYRGMNSSLVWNWENTVSYTRDIAKHRVTALVGTGALKESVYGEGATYRNLPVSTFKDASMNYSVATADRIANGYEGADHKVSSLFGRLLYSYDDKYLFTGIVRRDGSSRFGSNNKYGYFPSASVGWIASREHFWPANNLVQFLKLRGSYGVTGSDNIGDFKYVSTVGGGRNYTFGNDSYTIGYSPNAPSNPDLKWEQTSQTNIGFEAIITGGLSLTFDWFNKKTTGMLQPIILPSYVGASGSPTGNVADMSNKGIELELGFQRKIGAVQIELRGNISHISNEITNLGTVQYRTGAGFQSSDYEISRLAVGHPIGAFYGFVTNGIFQNQAEVNNYISKATGTPIQPNAKPGDFRFADLNGDGVINAKDRTFIGDPTPTWSYGFTASASYKNFDVIVFGQGVTGNQIFNGLRRLDIPSANWTTAALSRWTGEGSSNSFPRLVMGDPNKNFSSPSSFYLSDGAYFRIKTLQVGYTFSKQLLSRLGIQKLRIYATSNNLLTLTRYSGYDPEIGGGSYGIDRGIYPQARSFMLGVNLSF